MTFAPVLAVASDLETLGSGFNRLGIGFGEFANLAGQRKAEYDAQRSQLIAKGNRLAADKSNPFCGRVERLSWAEIVGHRETKTANAQQRSPFHSEDDNQHFRVMEDGQQVSE